MDVFKAGFLKGEKWHVDYENNIEKEKAQNLCIGNIKKRVLF